MRICAYCRSMNSYAHCTPHNAHPFRSFYFSVFDTTKAHATIFCSPFLLFAPIVFTAVVLHHFRISDHRTCVNKMPFPLILISTISTLLLTAKCPNHKQNSRTILLIFIQATHQRLNISMNGHQLALPLSVVRGVCVCVCNPINLNDSLFSASLLHRSRFLVAHFNLNMHVSFYFHSFRLFASILAAHELRTG